MANTCPHLTPTTIVATWHQSACAGKFQHVLDVLAAHQGHQELWNRRTNNCGRHMFTGGPDVRHSHAIATLTMAENHINTNSIGLQLQAEC